MKYNPDLQLEVLKKKFGLNLNWVEANIPMTYSEVEKYFGPECEQYSHLCATCNAWTQFYTNNQIVTVVIERDHVLECLGKPIENRLDTEVLK